MGLHYSAEYQSGLGHGWWMVTYYQDKKIVFRCKTDEIRFAHKKFEDNKIEKIALKTGMPVDEIRLELGYKI